jgi:phosphoribosylaminoimidazolecarboxamide formyltransferase/IMP cyclohydrolase
MPRALVSVADKRGLVPLAQELRRLGYEILSTGGTAAVLAAAGVEVTLVEKVTGLREMLDGRVKTLHPSVHAALLARRDVPAHMQALEAAGIVPIDVVVVNLYPFRETVASGASLEEVVENIDVGGPAMVRAAAKNHAHVTVVVDPDDYQDLLAALRAGGPDHATRLRYAAKAFALTAAYDAWVAEYLAARWGGDDPFPTRLTLTWDRVQVLRYGENPHQRAALYQDPFPQGRGVAQARRLQGKELSYTNLLDADAAWRVVEGWQFPAAAAVKHASPCGVAVASTLAQAYERARDADPVSIFGGTVAFSQPVDEQTARAMEGTFLEVVVAPGYTERARQILARRRNLRLLEIPQEDGSPLRPPYHLARIGGGLLFQEEDRLDLRPEDLKVVTRRAPTPREMEDLLMAWRVARHVRSNAIVLVRDGATVGIGGGQPSRVGAARLAIQQAGERARGSVLASDAFFPMPDTVEEAARAGVTAIIQPGGSVRDEASIDACDASGIAMVFTGVRHFRHG